MNYIVVEAATGNIVNRIVLEDPKQWSPPVGHDVVVDEGDMRIGGRYVAGVYTPPASEPVPPPIASPILDGAAFLARVTDTEYEAITGSPNVQVRRWVELLRLRGEIDVSGETSMAAKAGLVALGLLTAERADVIFAPIS